MSKVFITTSNFSYLSNHLKKILKSHDYSLKINDKNRKINEDEVMINLKDCEGVIAGTEIYSSKVLDQLSSLKVISRLGVGMDNIDMEAARERNIKVFKTQTTPAPAVAELVLGLMIDVSRRISTTNHSLKQGIWQKEMGSLLKEKTLGIVGLGIIGKAVVQLSKGFGFTNLAFDQRKDSTFSKKYGVHYCDLETLLKSSDIVSIHLNLSNQTKYLIDREKIELMKSDSILINTSRGEILDENALYVALKNKQLAGAGLDVFENEPYSGPLTKLDNVILTPHIGSYAKEIRVQMEMEAVENLLKGLSLEEK